MAVSPLEEKPGTPVAEFKPYVPASTIMPEFTFRAVLVGALLGIGGTFFTLYLLEKYFELPWRGVGWAWAARA